MVKAGNCLPELIAQSIGGSEIVITRGGQPVVKLVARQAGRGLQPRPKHLLPRIGKHFGRGCNIYCQGSGLQHLLPRIGKHFGRGCKPRPANGSAKISDDFDEPLEDFREYMW